MAIKLSADKEPEILWKTSKVSEKRTEHLHGIMNTAVIKDGYIYGACSYGEFRCLSLQTGKRVWESLDPVGLKDLLVGVRYLLPLTRISFFYLVRMEIWH